MKTAITMVLLGSAALAACDAGNYSNEDIDFQLAVPERADLAVKLPTQSLESADSAEHYRSTRGVVRTLNATADAFLSLIDHVRAYPPSERAGGHRVWGPFPIDESPLWFIRMVIDRVGAPGQAVLFEYRVQFRLRADASAAWGTLIAGNFTPTAGARRGAGKLSFTSAEARAAGYPLGGLVAMDSIDIEYKSNSFPLSLKVTVVNFPAHEKAVFDYAEEQDGAGEMIFTFPTPMGGVLVSSVEIRSRWTGSGAGRADVTVLSGLAVGRKGVDCWGIDTVATYVYRDWDHSLDKGPESSCVFPAP
jgi:hypothetical protein